MADSQAVVLSAGALLGGVRGVAAGAAAIPAWLLPATAVFCFRWVLLGALSCVLMGCGGANAVVHLIPYLKGGAEDGSLATLCYGLGSVLGEIPVYLLAAEMFASTRRALDRNRYPTGVLSWLHGHIGGGASGGASPSYPLLVALAAIPAPVDATAALCAACGTSLSDFFLAALIGKGLIRTQITTRLFEAWPVVRAQQAPEMEGIPEMMFLVSVVAFAGATMWWRARKSDVEIQLDDDE